VNVTLINLDTRAKILEAEQAFERADPARTVVVSGYFDPLTAAHARRLAALRSGTGCLIAVVLEPPEPILEWRARAELVAALACVDYVVCGASGGITVHEECADLERRANLIATVQVRCSKPCQA
jgi:hypothetical protein